MVPIKRVESGMTNLGETGCGNRPVNLLSKIKFDYGYLLHTYLLQELHDHDNYFLLRSTVHQH
jgi:hypothetical protein